MRRPISSSGDVARWIAREAYAAGATRVLWVRVVNGGPGWWITPEGAEPQGGIGWVPVLVVLPETAATIAAGGYQAWIALGQLAEQVEAAR